VQADTGALLWKSKAGKHISPTLEGGMLFTAGGEDKTVYALDATTGTQVWKYVVTVDNGYVLSWPAVDNGVVYVGSQDNRVRALTVRAHDCGCCRLANALRPPPPPSSC
jgi:outer membrane protein assembly factor BamB